MFVCCSVKTYLVSSGTLKEGFSLHFTTALVAGFVSAWASSPFDVVKSRVHKLNCVVY